MKHLITDEEAIAILETSGAREDTVKRFAMQLGAVLGARKGLPIPTGHVTCYSVAGSRSGNPGVNIDMNHVTVQGEAFGAIEIIIDGGVRLQLDVKSAMNVAQNIMGCAEAAISDVCVFRMLTEQLDLDVQRAGMFLLQLREIRQGSRAEVVEQ